MPLPAGHRLGPYEIEAPLGAGGMGEVYRARDRRLDRTVAVKVLPPEVAGNAGLRERFEREARAVASLTHPHICTLHDVGSDEGLTYLVMEHLEGETLAARLARAGSGSASGSGIVSGVRSSSRGGLPLEQTLTIAVQIADALERAHRQGIVHRDLKPPNVMLTKAGVKLLDFGLARIDAPDGPPSADAGGADAAPVAGRAPRSQISTQPSLTSHGTMLGTLPYMAPEQVEGRRADARTDIFAFGAILYEMLTGQRAFVAKSHASLIAAILEHEPTPVSALQPMVPPALARLVTQCLAKDPDDRWQSAGDVKRELLWIAQGGSRVGTPAPVAARRIKRARLLATSAVACALAAVGVGAWAWRVQTRVQGDRPLVHFQIPVAAPSDPFRFAVSPDGRRLAYVMAGEDGKDRLWLRPLDALAAQAIPGTEYATTPFWSPDGRHVAFASSGRLKRTDLDGGEPQPICDLPPGMAGGTWSRDGVIVFGTFPGHLYRVAATGGTPVPLLARHGGRSGGSTIRLRPHFLPDGKRFVFVDLSRDEPSPGIWLGSLDEAEPPRRLLDVPSAAAYAPEGHLLFARAGTLFARPFDVQKAAFTGESFPVVDGVGQDVNLGIAAFSVSQTGVLAYRPPSPAREQLVWFDRAGARLGTLGEPGRHSNFDLAADGTKVAVSIPDPRTGLGALWTIDVTRGVTTLVASSERESFEDPVWAPDGTRIAATTRRARPAIVAKPVRGGEVALLFEAENAVGIVEDWSADGRHLALLLVQDRNPVQRGGLLSLEEKGQPQLLEPELGATDELRFSPDGRWLAFAASPGGRWEIFVTTVPPRGERWQISTAGGMQPRWSRDGKELFYLAPDGTLMAVEVKTTAAKAPGAKLEAGMPRPLFATGLQPRTGYDQYAVAPDGRRFLLNVPIPTPTQPPIGVIVNWSAAFKR